MYKYYSSVFTFLCITVSAGMTFPLSKLALEALTPLYYLAIRYTLATIIMVALFFSRFKKGLKEQIKMGIPLGITIFLAYFLQTLGVYRTTASKTGFFTAISVVQVPIIDFIQEKKKPDRLLSIGIVFALLGLVLLTGILGGNSNLNMGDLLVFLCAFGFAYHIILVSRLEKEADPYVIATIQFAMVALFSFLAALFMENPPDLNLLTGKVWLNIFFLSFFATAFAYTAQIIAQRLVSSAEAALILTFEPVFSAVFSYFLLQESQNMSTIFGGIFIVLGLIISQFKDFKKAEQIV